MVCWYILMMCDMGVSVSFMSVDDVVVMVK